MYFFFKLKPKTHTRGGCSLVKLTVNIFLDKYSQNKNFFAPNVQPPLAKKILDKTRPGKPSDNLLFHGQKKKKKRLPFLQASGFSPEWSK